MIPLCSPSIRSTVLGRNCWGKESRFLKKSRSITWVLNIGVLPTLLPGIKSLVSPIPQTPFHTKNAAARPRASASLCPLPEPPSEAQPASQSPHPIILTACCPQRPVPEASQFLLASFLGCVSYSRHQQPGC